jgi:uncharacterized SAM-binding protein YcdF (DUF218 family)
LVTRGFEESMKTPARKKRAFLISVAVLALLTASALNAGRVLVIDEPRTSDVILILAGETEHRPARALQLLGEGYTRKVVMDVPKEGKVFEFGLPQLARRYVENLPQKALVSICPIEGLSTKDEVRDAQQCLEREGAKSVLIVTSDFHTRRALHIFQKKIPEISFSVAAVRDSTQFGARWWTHRQWAKTFLDEWLRLMWWDAVDQWL